MGDLVFVCLFVCFFVCFLADLDTRAALLFLPYVFKEKLDLFVILGEVCVLKYLVYIKGKQMYLLVRD